MNEKALQKIKQYCAYQERCHAEVKDKLYGMGLHRQEVDDIMAELITENFLNEERFAKAFAGGKFRVKQWGRKKIIGALKQKQVSEYCIRKAMEEIPEDAYEGTIKKLAEKKYNSLKGEQWLRRIFKTRQYLLARGFEAGQIGEILKTLTAKEDQESQH